MSDLRCEGCGQPLGRILLSLLDDPQGAEVDITSAVVAGRRTICQDCAKTARYQSTSRQSDKETSP